MAGIMDRLNRPAYGRDNSDLLRRPVSCDSGEATASEWKHEENLDSGQSPDIPTSPILVLAMGWNYGGCMKLRCSWSFFLVVQGLIFSLPGLWADDSDPVAALKLWVQKYDGEKSSWPSEGWVQAPLNKDQSAECRTILWNWFANLQKEKNKAEFESRILTSGEFKMPFEYKIFGEKPEGGRSLFISMHGGGGAPKRVNDQQWQNQIGLYEPNEGVYVAPRAPTDTWNLWHQDHIDILFSRLILQMVLFEDVNPDRVYLMGYSAGGDGVYQLAPRMASHFAAAAMMAGHPNETQPDGLRNIPFALYMGGKDAAYNRNKIAAEWKDKLKTLQDADPDGYTHKVVIYPDFGHWMQRQDAEALAWMTGFVRHPMPRKIIWLQDDVTHRAFYWIGVPTSVDLGDRSRIQASVSGQSITIQSQSLKSFELYLDDPLIDLDLPVKVDVNGSVKEFQCVRTCQSLYQSLIQRKDRSFITPVLLSLHP